MLSPLSWFGPLAQIIAAIEDPNAPNIPLLPPKVTLHGGITVTGVASGDLHSFLGIPFATAPRFDLPVPITYQGNIDATSYGNPCMQHDLLTTATTSALNYFSENNVSIPVLPNQSEECLSINVIKPASAKENSSLPVVVWFFGGGFLIGDDQTWDEMGKKLVGISKASLEDVIFVSFNYRLSAYGFLGGAEVQAAGAGNVGLRDQRVALEWVHNHISAFGGNPERVVLWGQSAGAISASLQMLAYNGSSQNLFHGAFLQSGAPLPLGSILNGQGAFDALAASVGCGEEPDKLNCLRSVPLDVLQPAVDATEGVFSESALHLSWHPSADGTFLTDNPQKLVEEGKVADIPVVTGNVDDEGTLFSVGKVGSIRTDAQFEAWIKSTWLPDATDTERADVAAKYPRNQTEGSPFGTGVLNQYKLNIEFKRIAAFQGDMVFQAPRRLFVKELANSTIHQSKIWTYLSKRLKTAPNVGSIHGGDVSATADNHNIFSPYMVKFANTLDPNTKNTDLRNWPAYTLEEPKMLVIPYGVPAPAPEIADDDHRILPFELLNELGLKYPL